MKQKSFLKCFTALIAALSIFFITAVCAGAVDGEDEPVTPTQSVETVAPAPETQPEIPTEPPTAQPAPTDPPIIYTDPVVPEPQDTEPQQEETYAPRQDSVETKPKKQLPTVAPATEKKKADNGDLTYGYFSWACVGAGVLVLAVVMLTTKRSEGKKNKRR